MLLLYLLYWIYLIRSDSHLKPADARRAVRTLAAPLACPAAAPQKQLHGEVHISRNSPWAPCPSALPHKWNCAPPLRPSAHPAPPCTPSCTCLAAPTPHTAAAYPHVSRAALNLPHVTDFHGLTDSVGAASPQATTADTHTDGPAQPSYVHHDAAALHPHELQAGQGRPLWGAAAGGAR